MYAGQERVYMDEDVNQVISKVERKVKEYNAIV